MLSLQHQHTYRISRPKDAPDGWMFSLNGVDFVEVSHFAEPSRPSRDDLTEYVNHQLRPVLEQLIESRLARMVREHARPREKD